MAGGLDFGVTVPPGGYAWWYVDAISDDGAHGLTVIAFIGSVFSPYYAWARRRGGGLPERHCAMNVALYGRPRRWTMTERGPASLARDAGGIGIGASALAWDGTELTITIDEITAPVPRRVRGQVRLHPAAIETRVHELDAAGRHRWRPLAPRARVEVALDHPSLSWRGHAYFDTNWGDRPLEADFQHWNWSRAILPGGDAVVLYDVVRTGDVHPARIAMRYGQGGGADIEPPLLATLPPTLWRLHGSVGADAGSAPEVTQRLEDAPFYARSVVRTRLLGVETSAVHEMLSLTRFTAPWVQSMLPFRMPRAAWRDA